MYNYIDIVLRNNRMGILEKDIYINADKPFINNNEVN